MAQSMLQAFSNGSSSTETVNVTTLPQTSGPSRNGLRGANQISMRVQNERLVLSILRRSGPLTRPDLSRLTGLSAQTISVIIRKLTREGLLVAGSPLRGNVGQPSIPLALAAHGAFFFGLVIGRRRARTVLTDFLGNILDTASMPFEYPLPDPIVKFVRESVDEMSERLDAGERGRIAGLGIAMPYRLWDWAPSREVPGSTLAPWETRDIRQEISEVLELPVYLENDASVACAAELVFGSAAADGDFMYLFIDDFIGGGVVLNGSLYTGRNGNAGAFGSMPTPDEHGASRQLIAVASLATLVELHRAHGHPVPDLGEPAGNWRFDEDMLEEWCSLASNGLADAITAATSVIEFESVLIDGRIPECLRARIVSETGTRLETRNFAGIEMPRLRAGSLGSDAPVLGAASLPLTHRYLVEGYAALPEDPPPDAVRI